MKRLIRTATNTCNIAAKPSIEKEVLEPVSASKQDVDTALIDLMNQLLLDYDDATVQRTGSDKVTLVVEHDSIVDELTVDEADLSNLDTCLEEIHQAIDEPSESEEDI